MLMGGWPSFCKATESDGTPPSEGVKRLCVGRPLRPGSRVTKVQPVRSVSLGFEMSAQIMVS